MLELATILKIAAGIVLLLAMWVMWVIHRQRRVLEKQNEELKRQKFANKQSRIVAEIAARLGRPAAPRSRAINQADSNQQPAPRRGATPAHNISADHPEDSAAAGPRSQPKPRRRGMPDPDKLERERQSLADRLAASNPPPPTAKSTLSERRDDASRNADRLPPEPGTGKVAHNDTVRPEDAGRKTSGIASQGDDRSAKIDQRSGDRNIITTPPLESPANKITVPPPAPMNAVPGQPSPDKARPPLSARRLPHPAPQPAFPELTQPAPTPVPPEKVEENTKTEREMALKLAPQPPLDANTKKMSDPHVKWLPPNEKPKPDAAPVKPSVHKGPVQETKPAAKPTPPRSRNNNFHLDTEASLADQINSYARWLADQCDQFTLERYENGQPVDLIPLWFDATELERRNGHWFGLFEPIELAPLMKQIKDADEAIYCPFSDIAVEALRGPALEILALVEANQSQRQQMVIKECALNEFVEFLDELKSMAAGDTADDTRAASAAGWPSSR